MWAMQNEAAGYGGAIFFRVASMDSTSRSLAAVVAMP
jgi:hypothetical protein